MTWRTRSSAAANYARIAQTSPVNDECFACGCLLWLSGDKKAFQELCQRVSASDTSERAVRLASVTADSGLLPANVLRVAMQPQTGSPTAIRDPAYVSRSITLAQYRAGLFGDARKQLEADIAGAPNLPEAMFWKREGLGLHWQLLALIEAREGRFDQAKEAATQSSRLIQDDPPKAGELAGASPFFMWLEYQVLKVELQDLLDKKP